MHEITHLQSTETPYTEKTEGFDFMDSMSDYRSAAERKEQGIDDQSSVTIHKYIGGVARRLFAVLR